jgi:hypothetical protein
VSTRGETKTGAGVIGTTDEGSDPLFALDQETLRVKQPQFSVERLELVHRVHAVGKGLREGRLAPGAEHDGDML